MNTLTIRPMTQQQRELLDTTRDTLRTGDRARFVMFYLVGVLRESIGPEHADAHLKEAIELYERTEPKRGVPRDSRNVHVR